MSSLTRCRASGGRIGREYGPVSRTPHFDDLAQTRPIRLGGCWGSMRAASTCRSRWIKLTFDLKHQRPLWRYVFPIETVIRKPGLLIRSCHMVSMVRESIPLEPAQSAQRVQGITATCPTIAPSEAMWFTISADACLQHGCLHYPDTPRLHRGMDLRFAGRDGCSSGHVGSAS
jgi:hypothetical protein